MEKFLGRYDLTDIKVTKSLIRRTIAAHDALQQIEAGIVSDSEESKAIAVATFHFFDLFGQYPAKATVNGHEVPLLAMGLELSPLGYFVRGILKSPWTGSDLRTPPMGLFGPKQTRLTSRTIPTWAEVEEAVKRAFPKAVITRSEKVSKDGTGHLDTVTVRPKFMQTDGYPLPTGASTCSTDSIALMQAAVRMLYYHLIENHGANTYNDLPAARSELKKTRLGMMYGMGAEKYGKSAFTAKTLLDALRAGKRL